MESNLKSFSAYDMSTWQDQGMLIELEAKPVSQTVAKRGRSGNGPGRMIVITLLAVGIIYLEPQLTLANSAMTWVGDRSDAVRPMANNVVGTEQLPDGYPEVGSAKEVVELSPIGDINRTFNKIFDSVSAGKSLIPSEEVRVLARKAIQSKSADIDVEAWAGKLANDIKDAKD